MADVHTAIHLEARLGGEAARCRVCGSGALATDEVAHEGRLLLAACGHCDHRFTQRLPDALASRRAGPGPRAAARGRAGEAATAA